MTSTPPRRPRLPAAALVLGIATVLVAALGPADRSSGAAPAGAVFVTGHDADWHAQGQEQNHNAAGARNIIRRAVAYVTGGAANPNLLLVTDVRDATATINNPPARPPSPHCGDSRRGLLDAGISGFAVADHDGNNDGGQVELDLDDVIFADYDAIIVASDFGGCLRAEQLEILNRRRSELIDYVNGGGGILAFGESALSNRFQFLPLRATQTTGGRRESGVTVTRTGASMGLTNADVNGNFEHNAFTEACGLDAVDVRGDTNPVSILSVAGNQGLRTGPCVSVSVADVSVTEGESDVAKFTVTLSGQSSERVVLGYRTIEGSALNGRDFRYITGTLDFPPGVTVRTREVPIIDDSEPEATETFSFELNNPFNASLLRPLAAGTILDNDVPPAPPTTDPGGIPTRPGRPTGAPTAQPGQNQPIQQGQIQQQAQQQGQQQASQAQASQAQAQQAQVQQQVQVQQQAQVQQQVQQQVQTQVQSQAQVQGQTVGQLQPGLMVMREQEIQLETEREGHLPGEDWLASARSQPSPVPAVAASWAAAVAMFALALAYRRDGEAVEAWAQE